MKPHFVNIQSPVGTKVGAGAGTGATTGADTKVKIFSQENSFLPKGDKLVYDKKVGKNIILFDNFHCKTPQPDKLYYQLVAGHKEIILSYHFDTQGCCQTHLLYKTVSNLALEMCFLSVI